MAQRKVIFLWWVVWALASCAPVQKKVFFEAPVVKRSAYVMRINDTVYPSARPGYLLRRLAGGSSILLLNKLNPPSGSTVNFIIPSAGAKAYSVILLPPDYVFPFQVSFLEGNTGKGSFRFEEKNFFVYKTKDYQLVTSNKIAFEKYLREKEVYFLNSGQAKKILNYANAEAPIQWIWFPMHIPGEQYWPLNDRFLLAHLGETYVWDMEVPEQSQYAGVILAPDSVNTLEDVFGAVDPVKTDFSRWIPRNSQQFRHFAFSSFRVWDKRWRHFKAASGYNTTEAPAWWKALKSVTQAGEKNEFTILTFGQLTGKVLEKSRVLSKYHDMEIYENQDSIRLTAYFYPLLQKESYPYFTVFDQSMVLAKDIKSLESFIDLYERELTSNLDKNFKRRLGQLPEPLHVFIYSQGKIFAAVYQNDQFFSVFDAGTSEGSRSQSKQGHYRLFTTIAPGELQHYPQWIYNHRTKKYELVWQNALHEVIWTDEKGKIRWRRNVENPVLGDFYRIDMYRNGKSQVLFATEDGLYVVDVRGAYVKPFPLKMKIHSPVGVFDYDRNRRYRIAVPVDKKLVMYDARGNLIEGFKPQSLQVPLQSAPQHLRIGTKDYIVLSHEDGQIDILNRRGEVRISVKQKIPLKTGRWFVYRNHLTAVGKDGFLVSIDVRGNISYPDKNLKIKEIDFEKNTYIATDGKRVYIDGKKLDLNIPEIGGVFVLRFKKGMIYAVEDLLNHRFILIEFKNKAMQTEMLAGEKWIKISPDGKKILTFIGDNIVIYKK